MNEQEIAYGSMVVCGEWVYTARWTFRAPVIGTVTHVALVGPDAHLPVIAAIPEDQPLIPLVRLRKVEAAQ